MSSAFPWFCFSTGLGKVVREQSVRTEDSTVLDYIRDASKKNGNYALLPASHEADDIKVKPNGTHEPSIKTVNNFPNQT